MSQTLLAFAQSTEPFDMPPKKTKKKFWKHKDVNNGEKSFAAGLNIYKILWVFIVGCFIGVVWETFYVFYKEGVFMRRSGMLYGPFNQVYGLGALLFTLLLYRFRKKNALIIFGASFVIGLIFEFLCSWVQEFIFGSVSWEYSHIPTNIGGRTNLFYGFGWGIMGLIFLTHIWPFLSEMIERIPNKIGKPVTIAFTVFLVCNMALSGAAVLRQRGRVEGHPATNAFTHWLDKTYPDTVMAEKYPSMEFVANRTDPAHPSPPQGAPAAKSS